MNVRSRSLRDSSIRPATPVAQRIHDARRAAGLSHDRLATMIGSSRQYLIKLEWGQNAPSREMLARIAEATGVTVDALDPCDEEAPRVAAVLPVTIHITEEQLDQALLRLLDNRGIT